MSPLENAIETFEATNMKIKALIDQHRNDPALRVDPLGMLLNGVVDAAVNGGINNYQVRAQVKGQRSLVKRSVVIGHGSKCRG